MCKKACNNACNGCSGDKYISSNNLKTVTGKVSMSTTEHPGAILGFSEESIFKEVKELASGYDVSFVISDVHSKAIPVSSEYAHMTNYLNSLDFRTRSSGEVMQSDTTLMLSIQQMKGEDVNFVTAKSLKTRQNNDSVFWPNLSTMYTDKDVFKNFESVNTLINNVREHNEN